MFLKEDLLMTVLHHIPDWGHSPEKFLEFIRITMGLSYWYVNATGDPYHGSVGTEEELADVFISVFSVELHPYKSFPDLNNSVASLIDLEAEVAQILKNWREDETFFELAEQGGIEPSMETVLEEGFNEFRAAAIVDKLRPYIQFY